MSFTLTVTIVFAFLGFIWKHNDALNFFIKLGFFALTFWGASIYFGV